MLVTIQFISKCHTFYILRYSLGKGGATNLKVGGGQYSKNTKIWKKWGVHDPPAPMLAPPRPLGTPFNIFSQYLSRDCQFIRFHFPFDLCSFVFISVQTVGKNLWYISFDHVVTTKFQKMSIKPKNCTGVKFVFKHSRSNFWCSNFF